MNRLLQSLSPTVRLLAVGVMLAGLGCAEVHYDYSKEVDPRTREFVIGVADVVRINVWKNPELSTEATVRPDGTVTMPLIGDDLFPAAGHTPTQLRQEVTKRLAEFVKDENATVTVAITAGSTATATRSAATSSIRGRSRRSTT